MREDLDPSERRCLVQDEARVCGGSPRLSPDPTPTAYPHTTAKPYLSQQPPPHFWLAIQSSIRLSSTSSGSAPESSTWSWKPRMSNLSPNSFFARSRSSRIFNCPTL